MPASTPEVQSISDVLGVHRKTARSILEDDRERWVGAYAPPATIARAGAAVVAMPDGVALERMTARQRAAALCAARSEAYFDAFQRKPR
jgi:hypothetical protein